MARGTANVKLRPIKSAFLIHPDDLGDSLGQRQVFITYHFFARSMINEKRILL